MKFFKNIFLVLILYYSHQNLIASSTGNVNKTNEAKVSDNNEIILGVSGASTAYDFCVLSAIATAISEQTGNKITLKSLPAKRLIRLMEKSLIHGDIGRTDGYSKIVPSALKVPTPLLTLNYFAYGLVSQNKLVENWESLKNYKLAQTRGYSLNYKYLKINNISYMNNMLSALRFVSLGRADFIVSNSQTMSKLKKEHVPEFNNIVAVGPPLASLNIYLYISENYPEFMATVNEAMLVLSHSDKYKSLISNNGC